MTNKEKVIDDTNLEWYGLTEEEINRIKNEKDDIGEVDIDTLYLATKIQEFLYVSWKEVSLDDILKFLKNSVKDNEKIWYYSIA